MKYTTNWFIERARKVHGDKYDYSKVNYINSQTKVCIICPIHGEFWQNPNSHLCGRGCPKCGVDSLKIKRRRSQEETIKQFIKVHGDKYIYTNVKYVNNNTLVNIICPEHGEFLQTPHSHLSGQGCPKCAFAKNSKHFRKSLDVFIKQAKEIYDDKYIYTKVEYINKDTKVCIICPEHGEFYITPRNFLNHHSCPKCYNERRNTTTRFNTDIFIERARKVHGDKYIYTKVNYVNSHTKVCIICPIHGEFWQIACDHLQGHGCPKCANQESKGETEIYDFLKTNTNILFERRIKNIIKPFEIDIYSKDLKIGIEFDGLTWHSVQFNKDKYNLLHKTNLCLKNNIKLIHILENQWEHKKEIVLSKLTKLFAENKNVDYNDFLIQTVFNRNKVQEFVDNNSLYDEKIGTTNICLIKDEKIYACLSLKHYKEYWKIITYVEDIDLNIKDCFETLLDFFKKNYEFSKIKVKVNKLWMTDMDIYLKNGFVFEKNIKSQFFYVNGKDKLLTENEYKKTNTKYYKLWDCGSYLLAFNKLNDIYKEEEFK